MPLSDDIRSLAAQVVPRLDEAREFYVHSRQTWRLVQQFARKGRPVGIVDLSTKRHLPVGDLNSRAQNYVTVRLAGSAFREISSLLEQWVLGLVRLWLTAYPEDLDLSKAGAVGALPVNDAIDIGGRQFDLSGGPRCKISFRKHSFVF